MPARTLVLLSCGLWVPAAGAWPVPVAEPATWRVARLLDETEIKTHDLDENLTLGKLLAALAGKLPKDARLTVEFDRAALGTDADRLAALPVRLRTHGTRALRSVLEDAVDKAASQFEVDYAVRPTGVALTRPRQAAVTGTYDLGDALRIQGRFLPDEDARPGPVTAARLVELLATQADLRPWETIDVLNGRRLLVFATPARQHAVSALVSSMTRLADLGVYMNARLYEVDRAFYKEVIAPVSAGKEGGAAPSAVRVKRPLLDKLAKHPVIQESEETKLAPEQLAVFLSRERHVRGVGMTGVSVAVRPEVSPDRRHLRLHLTQTVAELAAPAGPKGPDAPAAEPSVRTSTVAGTTDIRDGEAILIPIADRPPGERGADKAWVLVARPLIWIEAEERERGTGSRPRDIWTATDRDELGRELTVRTRPVPATEDAKAILQAVLTHLLTDKEIAGSREFYGTEADRAVLLSNSGDWAWPEGFRPDLHGYKLVSGRPGPFARREKQNRVLGIRIDRFEPGVKEKGLFDAPIAVCLFNAGGSANGAVIGGCSVYYVPKRVGDKWVVEFAGLVDP